MKEPDAEDVFGDSQARADALQKVFASETSQMGQLRIRKPSFSGVVILGRAGNRFVLGFSGEQLLEIFPAGADPKDCKRRGVEFVVSDAGLMRHVRSLMQLLVVGAASVEDLASWWADESGRAFDEAVFAAMQAMDYSVDELSAMFAAAFEVAAEIQLAKVKPAPTPPGERKGARGKKKGHAPPGS